MNVNSYLMKVSSRKSFKSITMTMTNDNYRSIMMMTNNNLLMMNIYNLRNIMTMNFKNNDDINSLKMITNNDLMKMNTMRTMTISNTIKSDYNVCTIKIFNKIKIINIITWARRSDRALRFNLFAKPKRIYASIPLANSQADEAHRHEDR